MRLLGFLLLLMGWLLVFAALVLLKAVTPLAVFLVAGLAVEALGLVFVARAHMLPRGDRE
jgi:hypothetical protein